MPDIGQIDIPTILLLASACYGAVVGASALVKAGSHLKETFVDKREKRLLDAAMDGSETLRTEVFKILGEAHEEHLEYERRFDRDNRRLNKLEEDVEQLKDDVVRAHGRIDDRSEESTITMKSIIVIMNKMLGLADDSDIIDSANEINEYLIERREK